MPDQKVWGYKGQVESLKEDWKLPGGPDGFQLPGCLEGFLTALLQGLAVWASCCLAALDSRLGSAAGCKGMGLTRSTLWRGQRIILCICGCLEVESRTSLAVREPVLL